MRPAGFANRHAVAAMQDEGEGHLFNRGMPFGWMVLADQLPSVRCCCCGCFTSCTRGAPTRCSRSPQCFSWKRSMPTRPAAARAYTRAIAVRLTLGRAAPVDILVMDHREKTPVEN